MYGRNGGRWFISLILLGLFITSIAWTVSERSRLTLLEEGVRNTLGPVQKQFTLATNSVAGFFSDLWSLGSLVGQNKQLNKQVSQLKSRVLELQEMEYQNVRLRQALGFKEENKNRFRLDPATVIGSEQRNGYRTVTIDKGSNQGVAQGMPVVTDLGLVGHVSAVSAQTATVLLILDNRSAVGGMVQINRSLGVVEGLSDATGTLRMIHLEKDAPVRANQAVITSGLGGLFPKGLPIGQILEVKNESNGLMKFAIIRPYADFSHLEEVFIVSGVLGIPETSGGKEGGQ